MAESKKERERDRRETQGREKGKDRGRQSYLDISQNDPMRREGSER